MANDTSFVCTHTDYESWKKYATTHPEVLPTILSYLSIHNPEILYSISKDILLKNISFGVVDITIVNTLIISLSHLEMDEHIFQMIDVILLSMSLLPESQYLDYDLSTSEDGFRYIFQTTIKLDAIAVVRRMVEDINPLLLFDPKHLTLPLSDDVASLLVSLSFSQYDEYIKYSNVSRCHLFYPWTYFESYIDQASQSGRIGVVHRLLSIVRDSTLLFSDEDTKCYIQAIIISSQMTASKYSHDIISQYLETYQNI